MLELSLHILDVIENATRAGASVIVVTLGEQNGLLEIVVEDNGPGFREDPDKILDPFYTTKDTKKAGLGLSLFRATAEQAGGIFELSRSTLGGASVRAVMQIRHIDRPPLGDLPGSLSGVLLTNPETDLWCRIRTPGYDTMIRTSEVILELIEKGADDFAIARRFESRVREALNHLHA